MKTIYGFKDPKMGTNYGIQPYDVKYQKVYDNFSREISLKDDLNWSEVKHLQNLLRKSDIWIDFPSNGLTIIDAEFKIAEQDQRVDILYLSSDGCIMPCELKITGESKDTHGQLIRYISDLCSINVDLDFVRNKFNDFVNKFTNDVAIEVHREKFENFIKTNNIETVTTSPLRGYIIDTEIKPQLSKAVDHLNSKCNFDIKLIKITTKVDDNWTAVKNDYLFRLDFEQINQSTQPL